MESPEKIDDIVGVLDLNLDDWPEEKRITYFSRKLKDRCSTGRVTDVKHNVDHSCLKTLGNPHVTPDMTITLVYFDSSSAAAAFWHGYTKKYDMIYCGKESKAPSHQNDFSNSGPPSLAHRQNTAESTASQSTSSTPAFSSSVGAEQGKYGSQETFASSSPRTSRHQAVHSDEHSKHQVSSAGFGDSDIAPFTSSSRRGGEKPTSRPQSKVQHTFNPDPTYENMQDVRNRTASDSASSQPELPPKQRDKLQGQKDHCDDADMRSYSEKGSAKPSSGESGGDFLAARDGPISAPEVQFIDRSMHKKPRPSSGTECQASDAGQNSPDIMKRASKQESSPQLHRLTGHVGTSHQPSESTSSQVSRPHGVDEGTTHHKASMLEESAASARNHEPLQSAADQRCARDGKAESGWPQHDRSLGSEQAAPAPSEPHEASSQVHPCEDPATAPQESSHKSASDSTDDPHACSLVMMIHALATKVREQMDKLMTKNKVAGSVVGIISPVNTDDIGMDDYSGMCAVVTFSDEKCRDRVKDILEGSGHNVTSLPEQLFGRTTVQLNAKLCNKIGRSMNIEELAKEYSITMKSGARSMQCEGNWLNLHLFESEIKKIMAEKTKGEEEERNPSESKNPEPVYTQVKKIKSRDRDAERMQHTSEDGEKQEITVDDSDYVKISMNYNPQTNPEPLKQSEATLQLSVAPQKSETEGGIVRMRSTSQGDDTRERSEAGSRDQDNRKPMQDGVSSTIRSAKKGRANLHLKMPAHGEGPRSPEMADDPDTFYDAPETLEQSAGKNSRVCGMAESTGRGGDGDEHGRKQDRNIVRKQTSRGHAPRTWDRPPSMLGAAMDEDLTGNSDHLHWDMSHEDTKMHEDMEEALKIHEYRAGEQTYEEIDPVDTKSSSSKVHDSEKASSTRDAQDAVPASGKRVLAGVSPEDPDSFKSAHSSAYNQTVEASPLLYAYLQKQPILKTIESKYTVSIKFSDDDITVSGDDQEDVSRAVHRVRETKQEMLEKVEMVKSSKVPSYLTREVEKIAHSGVGSTACVFDQESQRVFCMGSGAQSVIEEVNLMVSTNRECEETFTIDIHVMQYLSIPRKMPVMGDKVHLNMKPNEKDKETGIVTVKASSEADLKRATQEFCQCIDELSKTIIKNQVELKAIGAIEAKLLSKFPDVHATLHKDYMTVELLGPRSAVKEARKRILEMSNESVRPAADVRRLSQSVGPSGYSEPMSFWTPLDSGRKLYVHALVHDITRMKVDVIVNAANERLEHGGGVARAIAKAAGKELEDDCKDFIKNKGKLRVTNHFLSKPGHLPCKHVMHAVGPIWDKKGDKKKQEKLTSQLQETFRKCLIEASDKKYSSIAIPPISAGIFGFAPYVVATILAKVVGDIARTQKSSLSHIYLVDLSSETVHMIQKQLQQQKMLRHENNFCGGDACLSLTHQTGRRGIRRLLSVDEVGQDALGQEKTGRSPDSAAGFSGDPDLQTQAAMADQRGRDPMFSGAPSPPMSPLSPSDHFKTYVPEFLGSQKSSAQDQPSEPEQKPDPDAAPEKEDCPICLEPIEDLECLDKCGHKFCKDCIKQSFEHKPVCPICGVLYGKITGNQPRNGKMRHHVRHNQSLPGYSGCGTIVIEYEFPGGIQGEEHPNPGERYSGTGRRAYLPDNHEGRKVLGLLKDAFKARLVFTIGRSVTSGMENTVTWNDIHHKTNTHGGPERYGYPDPTYLSRVTQELAAKGITG